jgi:hypothetical protein
MQNINREKLEQAISRAISVFSHADVRYLRHPAVVDAIYAELTLGISRVPGKVLPEDLNAYIYALLALKAIPRATSNFQRQAVLRLLRVASAEIAKHQLVERWSRGSPHPSKATIRRIRQLAGSPMLPRNKIVDELRSRMATTNGRSTTM